MLGLDTVPNRLGCVFVLSSRALSPGIACEEVSELTPPFLPVHDDWKPPCSRDGQQRRMHIFNLTHHHASSTGGTGAPPRSQSRKSRLTTWYKLKNAFGAATGGDKGSELAKYSLEPLQCHGVGCRALRIPGTSNISLQED